MHTFYQSYLPEKIFYHIMYLIKKITKSLHDEDFNYNNVLFNKATASLGDFWFHIYMSHIRLNYKSKSCNINFMLHKDFILAYFNAK